MDRTKQRTVTITNGTWGRKDERNHNESSSSSARRTLAVPSTKSSSSQKKNCNNGKNNNNNSNGNHNHHPYLFHQNQLVETSPKYQDRTPTAKYIVEFHPLSYLFTVVRGNLSDDSDAHGNPRLPSAVLGVLNRIMIREYNAKITKLNREIDDIQKRIDGIHEKVNSLNRERRNPDSTNNNANGNNSNSNSTSTISDRNFGNEIYLLVRNVGMWMRRMETKAKLIEKIEWSIYILEALQEIDENCNATMFWSYASWRKTHYPLGPNGVDSDWDNSNEYIEDKYDKYNSDSNNNNNSTSNNGNSSNNDNTPQHDHPQIIRLFKDYEAAYRRNIEVARLINDGLARSSNDEKLSRYIVDNYIYCKGCKAMFSRRYDDLFGTRIRCPSRKLAVANANANSNSNANANANNFTLLSKGGGTTSSGEENGGTHLVMHFFCTDCFDAFNPSIIKKMKRDQERKAQRDLEALLEEHKQEQEETKNNNNNNASNSASSKSNKKRKKKKKKKGKKNNNNNSTGDAAATINGVSNGIVANDSNENDDDDDTNTNANTTTTNTTETNGAHPSGEQQRQSDNELESFKDDTNKNSNVGFSLTTTSYDESQKLCVDDSDEKEDDTVTNHLQHQRHHRDHSSGGVGESDVLVVERGNKTTNENNNTTSIDSSMNDVWVDFLCRTGSIIELNAFMDKTIGAEADLVP